MTDDSNGNPPPDDIEMLGGDLEVETCSFCGRSAFDVERMVVQGGARICNFCIKEFHARLNPNPKANSKADPKADPMADRKADPKPAPKPKA
jgi:ATP-dependent protease Clp ATPase subunit